MKRRTVCLGATALALKGLSAHAQPTAAWPARPVRLIVPWGAGGSTDIIARTIAQKLGDRWRQPVIVDNKPGGNSVLGAAEVARSAPDGYTLFIPNGTTMTANQFMYGKLPYDPNRDFTPICGVSAIPLLVMASASAPGTTLHGLIDAARRQPDEITFASAAGAQVQVAQWMKDWGVKFRYIPYKSAIDVTKALLGGEVHMGVDGVPNNLPHVRSGKIRGLAVNTHKRMPMVPEVATMDELRIKHTEPQIWNFLVAPARLPAAVQEQIREAVQSVLAMPDVSDKLVNELGVEILHGMGPAEVTSKLGDETALVGPLIKELGLKAN